MKKLGIRVAIGLLVLLAVTYVWPTQYRYMTACDLPVRINRFTGNIYLMSERGWVPLRVTDKMAEALRKYRTEEAASFLRASPCSNAFNGAFLIGR